MSKKRLIEEATEATRLAKHPGTNFTGKGLLPTTQEELEDWYMMYWPAGSGPIQQCRVICAALEEIAQLRGYTTDFVALKQRIIPGSCR